MPSGPHWVTPITERPRIWSKDMLKKEDSGRCPQRPGVPRQTMPIAPASGESSPSLRPPRLASWNQIGPGISLQVSVEILVSQRIIGAPSPAFEEFDEGDPGRVHSGRSTKPRGRSRWRSSRLIPSAINPKSMNLLHRSPAPTTSTVATAISRAGNARERAGARLA